MSKLMEELRGLQAYIGKLMGDEDKSYQDMFSDLRDEISNRISRHEHEDPSINGHGVTVCPKCAEPIAHCKDCQPFRDKPLAVLAKKKGYKLKVGVTLSPTLYPEEMNTHYFEGIDSVDKARAYLEGLK